MKKKIVSLLLAGAMCFAMTACGNSDGASETGSTAESKGTQIQTEEKTETSSTETSDATTEAKKELSGKVTVYMPSPSGLADDLAADFQAKTGVEVDVFQGTTGEILARLESCCRCCNTCIMVGWIVYEEPG